MDEPRFGVFFQRGQEKGRMSWFFIPQVIGKSGLKSDLESDLKSRLKSGFKSGLQSCLKSDSKYF